MTERYIPLSARGRSEETFDSLYEGIPAHMLKSLLTWVSKMIMDRSIIRDDVLMAFERHTRMPLPPLLPTSTPLETITNQCTKSHDWALDFIDFLLYFAIRQPTEVIELASILTQSGSAWRVADYEVAIQMPVLGSKTKIKHKLQRRVAEEIVTAAQEVMNSSGRAGDHLRKAWSFVYDRQPSPNDAFLEAVKAVEAAMIPVVSPNNKKATLGTMLGALKTNPQETIAVEMSTEPEPIEPSQVVYSMCQLLWKAQPDRHGTPDERVRSNVSQKSAEGAVHLAISLVQWFTSGVVRHR